MTNTLFIVDLNANGLVTTLSDHELGPYGVAVDPTANRVYWPSGFNKLSVIDGATDAVIAHITVNSVTSDFLVLRDVAVNTVTNRIYVSSYYGASNEPGELIVVDGSSHQILERIRLGALPEALAVNELTNRVYITDGRTNVISVIDGASNDVIASVCTEREARKVAVNEATNNVYAILGGSVIVINGTTNLITHRLIIGEESFGLAVDSSNDRVYAGSTNEFTYTDGMISVIGDGPPESPPPSWTASPAAECRIATSPIVVTPEGGFPTSVPVGSGGFGGDGGGVGGVSALPVTGGAEPPGQPALPLAAGVAVFLVPSVVGAFVLHVLRRPGR